MAKFRDDVRNHVVTWAEVHRDTKELARRLVGLGPWKGIVALTRGGLVPAAILARELDIRIVDTLCITSYDEQVQESIRVLKTPTAALADGGGGGQRQQGTNNEGTAPWDERGGEIRPHHVQGSVGQVDEVHDPEHQGQSSRQQEQ